MFERFRTKPKPNSESGSTQPPSSDKDTEKPAEQSYGSYSYKCSRCGKTPLSGPVLYCDGCGQYMCYECGIPSGDMIWDCPNCAIEMHRVVL